MRLKTLILLVFCMIVLVACGGGDDGGGGNEETTVDGEDIINIPEAVTVEGSILVWEGNGTRPNRVDSREPGALVAFSGDGNRESEIDLAEGTTRAAPCGERASTTDGRYFAFYAGDDSTGALYMMDNNTINEIENVGVLTCLGMGTFLYSDDEARFGYIDYVAGAPSDNSPSGEVVVRQTSNREEIARFDNAISFDLIGETLIYLGLFTDDEEAGVSIVTDDSPADVTTFRAEQGCTFRAGQIQFAGEDRAIVLLGEACSGRSSTWRLFSIDLSDNSATEIAGGDTGGGYFGNVRTSALFVSEDGQTAYIGIPNGNSRFQSDILSVDLVDNSGTTDELVRFAVMPHEGQLYLPEIDAHPVISNDGGWWAIASKTPDDIPAMNLINVAASNAVALDFEAGNADDTVSAMAFTPDSGRLFYVGGGNDSDDNSLFVVELFSGVQDRLLRGRFAKNMVLGPEVDGVVIGNWELIDEPRQDSFMDLVRVNLEDNTLSVIRTGADVTETQIANKRFFYPLRWR